MANVQRGRDGFRDGTSARLHGNDLLTIHAREASSTIFPQIDRHSIIPHFGLEPRSLDCRSNEDTSRIEKQVREQRNKVNSFKSI